MKTQKNYPIYLLLVLVVTFPLGALAQDDSRPWERLGLSLTEWKLIQDNGMPMDMVEKLLKDGIGISEYFSKPWEACNISESEWIEKRRSGLTNYDIEQAEKLKQKDFLKSQKPVETTFQEYDVSNENRLLLKSFLLPGYVQMTSNDVKKGRIMVGIAAGAVVGTVGLSIAKKQFISLPLVFVLVPDMIWSLADERRKISGNPR